MTLQSLIIPLSLALNHTSSPPLQHISSSEGHALKYYLSSDRDGREPPITHVHAPNNTIAHCLCAALFRLPQQDRFYRKNKSKVKALEMVLPLPNFTLSLSLSFFPPSSLFPLLVFPKVCCGPLFY